MFFRLKFFFIKSLLILIHFDSSQFFLLTFVRETTFSWKIWNKMNKHELNIFYCRWGILGVRLMGWTHCGRSDQSAFAYWWSGESITNEIALSKQQRHVLIDIWYFPLISNIAIITIWNSKFNLLSNIFRLLISNCWFDCLML